MVRVRVRVSVSFRPCVTTWYETWNCVCASIVLCVKHLNFTNLDHIMPTTSVVCDQLIMLQLTSRLMSSSLILPGNVTFFCNKFVLSLVPQFSAWHCPQLQLRHLLLSINICHEWGVNGWHLQTGDVAWLLLQSVTSSHWQLYYDFLN